ncbi:MAG TPA: sensor histidine kinase [Verrucomicrobiae bacterium]|nr:sensor histidine kinase [Verrucomicrobiae bacterium]
MAEILQLNLTAMYFLYGLSFFTMGIAIAFQYRSYSSFRLADSLRFLAAFGMLHGLSEWGSVFIPDSVPYFDQFSMWKAIALQRLLQSVSLFFLFFFGIKLIFDSRRKNYWWFSLPITALAIWFIQFAFFIPLLGTNELAHWLLISESWGRYLLALPAGLVTAYGLYLQIPEVRKINHNSAFNLRVAIASFFLFAIFSGVVVPQEIVWFSHVINVQTFRNYTGLPIEVFRTATAFMATWSMTRLLTIFDLETQRQIMESRRLEAIYLERERFARDLHDDVIQSFYGIGIELQTITNFIGADQEKAVQRVNSAVKRINEVIQGLRTYIQGLEAQDIEGSLEDLLTETVNQIRGQTGLEIALHFKLDAATFKEQSIAARDWKRQIGQIVREALTNVVQHANASRAEVEIQIDGNYIYLTIKDDGQGMPADKSITGMKQRKHRGLQNMQTRTRLLGGNFKVLSKAGKGTDLIIDIPLAKE